MPDTPITIVLADDDALTRSAYKAVLQRAGYTVHVAQDGEEATRLVERGGVSLLILDILMPRKEGLETLIEMKNRFPALAIIAISAGGARGETDFLSLATKFGADGILRKPFPPKALLVLISELLPETQQRVAQVR
jgi:two-component system, chemotaxis family, chemotaxis protein CheY